MKVKMKHDGDYSHYPKRLLHTVYIPEHKLLDTASRMMVEKLLELYSDRSAQDIYYPHMQYDDNYGGYFIIDIQNLRLRADDVFRQAAQELFGFGAEAEHWAVKWEKGIGYVEVTFWDEDYRTDDERERDFK